MTVSRSQPKGVEALAHYVAMRTAQPMRGLGCSVHEIHKGTEFEAAITFFDIAEAVNSHATLKARVEELEYIVKRYSHDGSLQTFEDRERFREEARSALQPKAGS